MNMALNLVLVD